MRALLAFSKFIDAINERIGKLASAALVIAVLITAATAMVRYAYDNSSNAFLEIQWYLFAAVVMLGAAATFRRNEHVRVDILYARLSPRGKLWLDLVGTLAVMLPVCIAFAYLSWPIFVTAWRGGEVSSNAGGLTRWPFALLVPLGFALLVLQGISEIIKRIVALCDAAPIESNYERPLQ